MAVVGFGLLSHVPTIMLPEEVRRDLNEGQEISLVPGLRRLRNEVFDELEPETFVILDTHWASTVEHLLAAQARRSGRYTSDELPRGMHGVPYDYPGDPELAHAAEAAAHRLGQPAHASDDPYLPVHYPTINLLHYLWRGERVVSVSCCQTGTTPDFLAMGQAIGEAAEETGRRTVLLASGGMSHRFWPLPELPLHEASDPVHVRTPEARAADEERLEWLQAGDHRRVVETMDDYARFAPEGRFGHYLMAVAATGGADCKAPGRLFSEYENAVGTGQVHIWFDRPAGGWTEKRPTSSSRPRTGVRFIGIDVSAKRGCAIAALDSAGNLLATRWAKPEPTAVAEAIQLIRDGDATLTIGIDAPRRLLAERRPWYWDSRAQRWSKRSNQKGWGRHCEAVVQALGLANPQWTPPACDADERHAWMTLGSQLFAELEDFGHVHEVFPSASYAQFNKRTKPFVRLSLQGFGTGPKDVLDAVVAALTVAEYEAGRGVEVGGGDSLGSIVLPCSDDEAPQQLLNWPAETA